MQKNGWSDGSLPIDVQKRFEIASSFMSRLLKRTIVVSGLHQRRFEFNRNFIRHKEAVNSLSERRDKPSRDESGSETTAWRRWRRQRNDKDLIIGQDWGSLLMSKSVIFTRE